MSSYDVIRVFKRNFGKSLGKVGHFGTLDPFACGVLLVGVGGAARLNDYIHDCMTKTYLAVGKLGEETDTGDFTSPVTQTDASPYLAQTVAKLDKTFIENSLKKRFEGEYMQSPHKYSAAKFQGKKLLQWAKEGVEIKKEQKKRHIYNIEVVKYDYPYLSIRFEVSSGTYIRTLFSECANHLGTIGALVSLVRENVGHHSSEEAIKKRDWPKDKEWRFEDWAIGPEEALKFPVAQFAPKEAKLMSNGVNLALGREEAKEGPLSGLCENLYWAKGEKGLIGLASIIDGHWKIQVNLS